MVLLVGLEKLTVFIQAESFTHQPVGTFCILLAQRIKGFIAQAAEPLAIGQQCRETELPFLRGMDVEALQTQVAHLKAVSILYLMHRDEVANFLNHLGWQYLKTDVSQQIEHFSMTPYTESLLFFQGRANHPYHPQKMIGVSMSNKDIMEIGKLQICFFHLIEYAVAASCIYHKHAATTAAQGEAGVIASHSMRIARTKHGDEVLVCIQLLNSD
jgi:hypothetical protein